MTKTEARAWVVNGLVCHLWLILSQFVVPQPHRPVVGLSLIIVRSHILELAVAQPLVPPGLSFEIE
jgi:hypothetical protein